MTQVRLSSKYQVVIPEAVRRELDLAARGPPRVSPATLATTKSGCECGAGAVKVVDSCGWLEVLAATPLGETYRSAFSRLDELVVPTVCVLEVAQHLLEVAGDAAELWTHDEHFRGLPGVRFVEPPPVED